MIVNKIQKAFLRNSIFYYQNFVYTGMTISHAVNGTGQILQVQIDSSVHRGPSDGSRLAIRIFDQP